MAQNKKKLTRLAKQKDILEQLLNLWPYWFPRIITLVCPLKLNTAHKPKWLSPSFQPPWSPIRWIILQVSSHNHGCDAKTQLSCCHRNHLHKHLLWNQIPLDFTVSSHFLLLLLPSTMSCFFNYQWPLN